MAAIDHTARTRLQVRNEPPSPPDPFIGQRRPPTQGMDMLDSYAAKLAGISLAVNVIQGLLERSESSKQSNASRSTLVASPLNPVQTTGLHAAVYLLQRYADTLNPEPGG